FAQTGSGCGFFVLGGCNRPPSISASVVRPRAGESRSLHSRHVRNNGVGTTARTGDYMTIAKTIAASMPALALMSASALAADIVTKAPKKIEAAPTSCFDLAV